MKLTDLFLNNRQQIQNSNSASSIPEKDGSMVSKQIRALTPGQTIHGEVISRSGNEAQIKINDDLVLNAKIDSSIALEEGKNLTFEVRNNGSSLTLSPLYANTATDSTALKALDMAGLPVTQETSEMATLMMKAGLSIDKNSLTQMFREMNLYSDASVSDLVDLHKLGMNVNETTVNQIVAYKNLNHQILGGMNEVANGLGNMIQELSSNGQIREAAGIYQELLQMVVREENSMVSENGAAAISQEGMTATETGGLVEGQTVIPNAPGGEGQILSTNVAEAKVGVDASATVNVNAELATAHSESATIIAEENAMSGGSENKILLLDESVLKDMGQLIQDAGNGLENSLTAAETLSRLGKLLEEGDLSALKSFLQGEKVEDLLSKSLEKLWTIKPEEVGKEHKVEELYQRLDRQLKSIMKIMEDNGQNQTDAYKATSNMNQNLDFLHQFNQMYTYVQLPLKMMQGNANGDLYVYTNKRNLADKEGPITAFLHLDMEHLGPVDVHVTMENTNVSTRFCVADDDVLDFLEEHMDILTERLNKRGYTLNVTTSVKDQEEAVQSGVVPFLNVEGKDAKLLSQYAFDVRA